MNKIPALIVILVLMTAVFAGCIDSDGENGEDGTNETGEDEDDVVISQEYKTDDSWSYMETDETMGELSITLTVVDNDTSFSGHDVYEMDIKATANDYEDDGLEFKDVSGSGTRYSNGINYEELELSGEVYYPDYNQTLDFKVETITETTTTGSRPDEPEVGDTYTITRTSETETKTYIDGELFDEESETDIQHRDYEIEEEETVSVAAGDFECIVISWTSDEGHGTMYYSTEVKNHVKRISYDADDEPSVTELVSYNVS